MEIDYNIKILMAEDSKITMNMQVKILNELGFKNIIEAINGDDAIAKISKESDIEIIISDWNMPEKNGYELLLWAKSQENYKDIPFILATAQAEKKQIQKIKDGGAQGIITKPFSPDELKDVIFKILNKDAVPEKTLEEKKQRKSSSGKVIIRVAHIQITDHLTLGVLKHLINNRILNPIHFELETRLMSSWNPVQKALEKGEVDAGFILAPIAMDLFNFGVGIKLILLAHKNGSICVKNKIDDNNQSLYDFFLNKTFYIPYILSIHHMLSAMMLDKIGLKPGLAGNKDVNVFFEVVPPIKMPEFIASNKEVAGYMVAEPLGSKAIFSGNANSMFLSGELWNNHPCCVVAMQDDFISKYEDAVMEFVQMMVIAGRYISYNPEISSNIGVEFLDPHQKLGLKSNVLLKVLQEPFGIKTNDLFPVIEDLDRIQRYMTEKMNIGELIDLEKFIDSRFAKIACQNNALGKLPYIEPDFDDNLLKIITN